MCLMRACVCALSVRIPPCGPVNDAAGHPTSCSAIATSAIETISPVASSVSTSRARGVAETSRARRRRRSVSPAIADTTTTTWCPSWRARCTRVATACMRSILPTDVPPYFWTTTPIRWLLFLRLFDAHAHRLTLDRGQCRNGLQRLADTALTRLVGHHHHRHGRILGMSTAFLQHRFNADGMLTEDAGNGRYHPRLLHPFKAHITLTDRI